MPVRISRRILLTSDIIFLTVFVDETVAVNHENLIQQ